MCTLIPVARKGGKGKHPMLHDPSKGDPATTQRDIRNHSIRPIIRLVVPFGSICQISQKGKGGDYSGIWQIDPNSTTYII